MTKPEHYVSAKGWDHVYDGGWIKCETCPFCHRSEWKFGVDRKSGGFNCFHGNCAVKGGFNMLQARFGYLPGDAPVKSAPTAITDGAPEPITMDDVLEMHHKLLNTPETLDTILEQRHWELDTVHALNLGLSGRALVYPHFDATGVPVFLKYRSLGKNPKVKFWGSKGHDATIYNVAAIRPNMEYLFIVAGEADAVSLINLGETNVVGIPGERICKPEWIEFFRQAKRLILIYDNDEAGELGRAGFVRKYPGLPVTHVNVPRAVTTWDDRIVSIKDIGEWTRSAFPPYENYSPETVGAFYRLRERLGLTPLVWMRDVKGMVVAQ